MTLSTTLGLAKILKKKFWIPFLNDRLFISMNELTKMKISRKLTGRKKSATHRKHISFALTNRKLSDEHKKHIGEAMQKYWQGQLYQY